MPVSFVRMVNYFEHAKLWQQQDIQQSGITPMMRVLIADNRLALRQSIQRTLKQCSDIEVVGEAEDGMSVVDLARTLMPDVIIMDVKMPGLNGGEATMRIRSMLPGVRIIACSTFAPKELVQHMFTAGASGFILKDRIDDELIPLIHDVMKKRT